MGYKLKKNKNFGSIDSSLDTKNEENDKYELENLKLQIKNEINKLISLNE